MERRRDLTTTGTDGDLITMSAVKGGPFCLVYPTNLHKPLIILESQRQVGQVGVGNDSGRGGARFAAFLTQFGDVDQGLAVTGSDGDGIVDSHLLAH